MRKFKNKISFLIIFSFILCHSQKTINDSLRGDFIYKLKAKMKTTTSSSYIYDELFSLQVDDKRAVFISNNSLKFDSIMFSELNNLNQQNIVIDFRGKSFPKTKFPFTILQSNEDTEYLELVGMSLLSYKEPKIINWKLINEEQVVNTLKCRKAEINYKGRDWIAWYSTEIPLPYGPYKFRGLPGLIVKISDQKGDYDFELVKSSSRKDLKGKTLYINKRRYNNSTETTKLKFEEAKKNFKDKLLLSSEDMGVVLTNEQRENLRQRQILNKSLENPIELDKQ